MIELLVVVAIIAVLVAILLPALSKAREQARSGVCANNCRQLGMAQEYYAQEYGVYAVYHKTGTPAIYWVYPYLMKHHYKGAWPEPDGTVLNSPPHLCPDLPPAVKIGPVMSDGYSGNPYPYGWNSELGVWYYGSNWSGPVKPYTSPSQVEKPSGCVGWADAMYGGSGMIFGPQSWDHYYYWRPAAPRHGPGFKGLEPYGPLGSATLQLYPRGSYANASFLDGHCEPLYITGNLANSSTYLPRY